MAALIDFAAEEDRLRAIDVLVGAEETYHRIPKGCFLVSDIAARLLTDQGIPFRLLGGPPAEEE